MKKVYLSIIQLVLLIIACSLAYDMSSQARQKVYSVSGFADTFLAGYVIGESTNDSYLMFEDDANND